MSSNYPKEAYSCVRQQTFAVQPELFLANPEKGEDPAKIYGQFSRIIFTILGKPESGKRNFVTSNVSLEMFEEIKQISLEAHGENTKYQYSSTQVKSEKTLIEGNSPAYTVAFTTGNLKGKTPAQVFWENEPEKAAEILDKQYAFLADNVDRYPGNQKSMDAIKDALTLLMNGKLIQYKPAATATAVARPCITIFKAMHGNPYKPHSERKDYFACHETKILWNVGDNYPVSVSIENYYAPIKKDDFGRINVEIGKKLSDCTKKLEFRLTGAEWLHCLAMIEKSMVRFEMVHAKQIENAIETCDRNNRIAAVQGNGVC